MEVEIGGERWRIRRGEGGRERGGMEGEVGESLCYVMYVM